MNKQTFTVLLQMLKDELDTFASVEIHCIILNSKWWSDWILSANAIKNNVKGVFKWPKMYEYQNVVGAW